MITYAVQYLEPDPEKVRLAPDAVRDRLQMALKQLPIAYVLLGWNLPAPLVHVCRDVTAQGGVKLFL